MRLLPVVIGFPELAEVADPQRPPVGLNQIGDQLVHRAHLAPVPGLHGGRDHLAQALSVLIESVRVRTAVTDAVAQLAVGIDVECLGRLAAGYQHNAARAQGMPHAQFVPDIGVVYGQVDDHQVGDQELLKHIDPDVARAGLLIGPKRGQPGGLECRPDQLRIDAVEIQGLTHRAPAWCRKAWPRRHVV